jgi:hypothetical protein
MEHLAWQGAVLGTCCKLLHTKHMYKKLQAMGGSSGLAQGGSEGDWSPQVVTECSEEGTCMQAAGGG